MEVKGCIFRTLGDKRGSCARESHHKKKNMKFPANIFLPVLFYQSFYSVGDSSRLTIIVDWINIAYVIRGHRNKIMMPSSIK